MVIVTDGRGDCPPLEPEAAHETRGDVAVDAMPFDHRDLDEVAGRIGPLVTILGGDVFGEMFGKDLAIENADHIRLDTIACRAEILGRDRWCLDRTTGHRRRDLARREGRVVHHAPAGQDHMGAALVQVVQHHDVGPLARRDLAAILQAERLGRRKARRAIDGKRGRAQPDQLPDHVIEVTVFRDVERISVVRAQAHIRAGHVGQKRLQGIQVLRNGAFADQHPHALLQFLARFPGGRGLMLRPYPGGDIGVEVPAQKLRAMAVDVAAAKCLELFHAAGILVDDTGIIHELRQPDHLWRIHERHEIGRRYRRARGLHRRGRHAGRQVHPDVHHRLLRAGKEILDPRHADHVGDLVRVADRRRHPTRAHAAVEFVRRDEGAFDVQMGVYEAGNERLAGHVDHLAPLVIGADPDDGVAADRDIAGDHGPRHHIQHLPAAQYLVGRGIPPPLGDQIGQRGAGHGIPFVRESLRHR